MTSFTRIIAAAAIAAGLFAGPAFAGSTAPSQDSVNIVPASAPAPGSTVENGFKRGKIVSYNAQAAAGSIIINTKENRLYFILGEGKAVMYRVATAKRGFEWKGTHQVSAKTKWPSWRPPASMRARHPETAALHGRRPREPAGRARPCILGSSIYRIHGTNAPESIGKAASSGCIRMLNQDVTELYNHVKIGATVIVR